MHILLVKKNITHSEVSSVVAWLISFSLFILVAVSQVIADDRLVYDQQKKLEQIFDGFTDKFSQYTWDKKIIRQFKLYYDTPDLDLLKASQALIYTAKEKRNDSNNQYIKHKKKYETSLSYYHDQTPANLQHRNYNQVKIFTDKHALFFLIKRTERELFIKKLKEHGIKQPLRIKPIFSVATNSIQYTVSSLTGETLTVILEKHWISLDTKKHEFTRLLFIASNKNATLNGLKSTLQNKFPALKEKEKNNYAYLYQQLSAMENMIEYKIKYSSLYHFMLAFFTAIIGLIVIKLLFFSRVMNLKFGSRGQGFSFPFFQRGIEGVRSFKLNKGD